MLNNNRVLIGNYIKYARTLRHTLCEDLYADMNKFLPNELIINPCNFDSKVRFKNQQQFIGIIRKFLDAYDYTQVIKLYFEDIESIINAMFIDYVLNFLKSKDLRVEIFTEPLCICCDYLVI